MLHYRLLCTLELLLVSILWPGCSWTFSPMLTGLTSSQQMRCTSLGEWRRPTGYCCLWVPPILGLLSWLASHSCSSTGAFTMTPIRYKGYRDTKHNCFVVGHGNSTFVNQAGLSFNFAQTAFCTLSQVIYEMETHRKSFTLL